MKVKILAILEVSITFVLLILIFRFVQSSPLAMEITDSLGGFLLPGYAVLLVASSAIYIGQSQRQSFPIFPQNFRYQLEITGLGFFPIFVLSVVLSWIDWTRWGGAILISIIEIGLLFWFAYLVKKKQPSTHKAGIIGGLILFSIASQFSNQFGDMIIAVIYFYIFVALSEELLFRGYFQSRLNSVFGRPRDFFGIHCGWGLILSSVLFGLWHCGWQFGMLDWPHVLWTVFAGVIFGFVREKSEGMIASAILHGIMNYGPQAILFYLFWSK